MLALLKYFIYICGVFKIITFVRLNYKSWKR